jgi:hypothetical protein
MGKGWRHARKRGLRNKALEETRQAWVEHSQSLAGFRFHTCSDMCTVRRRAPGLERCHHLTLSKLGRGPPKAKGRRAVLKSTMELFSQGPLLCDISPREVRAADS